MAPHNEKRPAEAGRVEQGHCKSPTVADHRPANDTTPEPKWRRVLWFLVKGGVLDLFLAERLLHDHVLRSTVSEIQRRFGLVIQRKLVCVPGYRGEPVRICKYWMEPEEREKARRLLVGG